MDAFTTLTGIVAPLDRVNVDTDQIIPKQYLKTIKRTGLREGLFSDWRYASDGNPQDGFVLNQPRYDGASLLLARDNFGCGSSREHARGPCWTTVFDALSPPALPISFLTTASRTACCQLSSQTLKSINYSKKLNPSRAISSA